MATTKKKPEARETLDQAVARSAVEQYRQDRILADVIWDAIDEGNDGDDNIDARKALDAAVRGFLAWDELPTSHKDVGDANGMIVMAVLPFLDRRKVNAELRRLLEPFVARAIRIFNSKAGKL